ncbi:MAG: UDP-N-acetylmuramate dehydrogenase [Oscillospiraceae bacterium]
MDKISLLLSELRAQFHDAVIREDEPMSAHTTFRIGGRVRALMIPKSTDELCFIESRLRKLDIPFLIIGNGSNLLFSDRYHELVVIKTSGLDELTVNDGVISAGAGVLLSKIASAACLNGLAGFEFAGGIPGSLGGAVYMNAGAYGGEMKDVIQSVCAFEEERGVVSYSAAECGFSYRHSRFCQGGTVLRADIRLTPGDPRLIRERMEELAERRREKQPLNFPSAGSTFKRPETGYAAAMIDEAGLKGYTVGGAQVSEKHAGFVINRGGATFEDVLAVIEYVKKKVYEKTGVELSPEVKIIH